jgi:uncharacterized membrane protein YebE (DUF533 family)
MLTNKTISKSEFMMWRCLVALAHLDGVVSKEERNVLSYHFSRRSFSQEQLSILNEDIATPQNFREFYLQIDNENERSELVQLAYTLFWADSDFDASERKVYDYLARSIQH